MSDIICTRHPSLTRVARPYFSGNITFCIAQYSYPFCSFCSRFDAPPGYTNNVRGERHIRIATTGAQKKGFTVALCVFVFKCPAPIVYYVSQSRRSCRLPCASLSWSHNSLLWLLPLKQEGGLLFSRRTNTSGREAIAGCCHHVCSKADSISSYKCIRCVVFWSDMVQLMCFRLV